MFLLPLVLATFALLSPAMAAPRPPSQPAVGAVQSQPPPLLLETPEEPSHYRLFGEGALGAQLTNSNKNYPGGRLALGLRLAKTPFPSTFFGFYVVGLGDNEHMDLPESGLVKRFSFLPFYGKSFWDDHLLLRGMVGVMWIHVNNPLIADVLRPTFGLGVGSMLYRSEAAQVSVEMIYESTGPSRASLALGLTNLTCGATCQTETKRAHVLSLNLVANLGLTK